MARGYAAPNRVDMTGQRFGHLIVVSREPNSPAGASRWRCQCDCGGTGVWTRINLTRGDRVRGCRQCVGARRGKSIATHGGARTRLYEIWCGMKKRCQNPSAEKWHRYGGRGITVCAEWEAFPAFRDWAFHKGYADDLTIDRLDNDGPYAPWTCEWVTSAENSRRRHERERMARFAEALLAA